MDNFKYTNQKLTDSTTGEVYWLMVDSFNHQMKLRCNHPFKETSSFYANMIGESLPVKLNNSKVIELANNSFYTFKPGEQVVAVKYPFKKRFTKVK